MGLQDWLLPFIDFASNIILPFLMALALLFFFWNLVRYAIIGGTNEQDREKARTLMLWGIIAFVVMFFIWGIVNVFTTIFGFQGYTEPITPDYILEREKSGVDPCVFDPFGPGCNPSNDPCEINPNDPACNPV